MPINVEEGSKQVREQEAWAQGVFPAAHERPQEGHRDTATQPFVDVLTELVQAQGDTVGFVVLHRWAEILERHFPLELPDLGRTIG
ncbi:hypothetical protein [Streptomyces sp. NBC_00467]|uniref:hypothetical protein n=1 Tax=Streptomyces sp. NBC_00467 TaxID=2975752 RepID=UPI002E17FC80